MELEKFEEAKKIKEDLDKFESQKHKLEWALKSCSLSATIGYSVGSMGKKGELYISDKQLIKEMLNKELDNVNQKIEETKILFEKL